MLKNTNKNKPMTAFEAQEAALVGCARHRVAAAVTDSILNGGCPVLRAADVREYRHLTEILEREADNGWTAKPRGIRYSGNAGGGWDIFLVA